MPRGCLQSQIGVGVTSALFCPDASHRPKVTKCFSPLTADISSTSHAILFKVSGVPGNDEKGLQLNFGGHRVAGAPPQRRLCAMLAIFRKIDRIQVFRPFSKKSRPGFAKPQKKSIFSLKNRKTVFAGLFFPSILNNPNLQIFKLRGPGGPFYWAKPTRKRRFSPRKKAFNKIDHPFWPYPT